MLEHEDTEIPHIKQYSDGWRVWNPISRMYLGDRNRNAFQDKDDALARLREMFMEVAEAKRARRGPTEAQKKARARAALSGDIFANAAPDSVLVSGEQRGFKFNGRAYADGHMPPLDEWSVVNERMRIWHDPSLGWEFEIFSGGGSTRSDALDPAEGNVRSREGILANFGGPNQRDVYEQMQEFHLAESSAPTEKTNDGRRGSNRVYTVRRSGDDPRRPFVVYDAEGYPVDSASTHEAAQQIADTENDLLARMRSERNESLYAYRPNDRDASERMNGRRPGEITPTMFAALKRIVEAGERGAVVHWRFTGSSRESHGFRKATLDALEAAGLIRTRSDRRPPVHGPLGGSYEEIDTYATATTSGIIFAARAAQ